MENILQNLLTIQPDATRIVLHRLSAADLARVAVACRDIQPHVEDVLKQRSSDHRHVHGRPYQDPIPVGFSTWASYLEWVDWITMMQTDRPIPHGFSTRASYLAWFEWMTRMLKDESHVVRTHALIRCVDAVLYAVVVCCCCCKHTSIYVIVQ